MKRRSSFQTLTGTRIYIRDNRYKYFSPEAIIGKKGKAKKWHTLATVDEGEYIARERLRALLNAQELATGCGDFPIWLAKWRIQLLQQREKKAPSSPPRLKIWENGTKSVLSALKIIEEAFSNFDIAQIRPADVALFVDQWEGQRSAQIYRSYLSKFFAWCCRLGVCNTNPAREIQVSKPPKRNVYITDEQFNAIREALLIGNDGRPTRTGMMVRCYMDLLYLLYQRGTDVRLLTWDQVPMENMTIKPTKTENTSGGKVQLQMTEDIRAVLATAKQCGKMRSIYVISTEHGQPYTANGIASLFKRACKRAGVVGVTLKDIRAKAATDAKNLGYSDAEIQIALVHTDEASTRGYIRNRIAPVSSVVLKLPKSK